MLSARINGNLSRSDGGEARTRSTKASYLANILSLLTYAFQTPLVVAWSRPMTPAGCPGLFEISARNVAKTAQHFQGACQIERCATIAIRVDGSVLGILYVPAS